jgi:hypothetical protein
MAVKKSAPVATINTEVWAATGRPSLWEARMFLMSYHAKAGRRRRVWPGLEAERRLCEAVVAEHAAKEAGR